MYNHILHTIGLVAVSIAMYSCAVTQNTIEDSKEREAVFNNYHSGNLSIGDTLIFTPEYIASNSFLLEDGSNGRKVTKRDHSRLASIVKQGSGKVYVNVCINTAGEPVFVSIDHEKTTIEKRRTLENALMMIGDYGFEPNHDAPQYQCGIIKLFLDINSSIN